MTWNNTNHNDLLIEWSTRINNQILSKQKLLLKYFWEEAFYPLSSENIYSMDINILTYISSILYEKKIKSIMELEMLDIWSFSIHLRQILQEISQVFEIEDLLIWIVLEDKDNIYFNSMTADKLIEGVPNFIKWTLNKENTPKNFKLKWSNIEFYFKWNFVWNNKNKVIFEKNILPALNNSLEAYSKHVESQYRKNYDCLTWLANRRYMEEYTSNLFEKSLSNGTNLWVMFIDLDHFKQINDNYSHAHWDEVLKEVWKVLSEIGEEYDWFTARIWGEELCYIISDISKESLSIIWEKILNKIRELSVTEDKVKVTTSIWISIFDPKNSDTASMSDILADADNAVYEAKDKWRNRIVFHQL